MTLVTVLAAAIDDSECDPEDYRGGVILRSMDDNHGFDYLPIPDGRHGSSYQYISVLGLKPGWEIYGSFLIRPIGCGRGLPTAMEFRSVLSHYKRNYIYSADLGTVFCFTWIRYNGALILSKSSISLHKADYRIEESGLLELAK